MRAHILEVTLIIDLTGYLFYIVKVVYVITAGFRSVVDCYVPSYSNLGQQYHENKS